MLLVESLWSITFLKVREERTDVDYWLWAIFPYHSINSCTLSQPCAGSKDPGREKRKWRGGGGWWEFVCLILVADRNTCRKRISGIMAKAESDSARVYSIKEKA